MRILILATFLIFLVIFNLYCLEPLKSTASRLGIIAALGFSPLVWDIKNNVLSDIPFLVFFFGSLVLLERLDKIKFSEFKHVFLSILSGIAIYLASGTRSVGILLIPALIAHDILNLRTIRRSSIIVVITFIIFYLIQSILLHTDKSYVDTLLHLDAQTILANILGYIKIVAGYWHNGFNDVTQVLMTAIALGLIGIGFIRTVRERWAVSEYFLLMYIGVLILWPARPSPRFLLPILPLAFLYFFSGLENMSWGPASLRKKFLPMGIFLIALSYTGGYSARDFSENSPGIQEKGSVEMFDFVRKQTPQDSIIIFWRPRILALYTGRKSSSYHDVQSIDQLWDYFKSIGSTHMIVQHEGRNFKERKTFLLNEVETAYKDQLKLIFQNADFHIYEIKR